METKKWWQSKTIWGILAAAVGTFLAAQGVDIAPPANADFEQLKQYYEQIRAAQGNIQQLIGIGLSAVGFIVALFGRITATKKI